MPDFDHYDIEKYDYKEIPLEKDIMLMSEEYMDEFHDSLLRMLGGEDCSPFEVGYVCNVAARRINEKSIEMSWYANAHTRFHEVTILVPKDIIKICVGCRNYDVRPYVFVDKDFLEHLYTREYSVFGLVDAIGVKTAIRNGDINKEMLLALRSEIDELASKYPDVAFVTFADSLLLKSNWVPGYFMKGIEYNYQPEMFVEIVKELRSIYKRTLNLDIYAVLAQGSNEYYDEPTLHISDSRNHVCLNSLGVPLAELLAIEKKVRDSLKAEIHELAELYMDDQYYHSLNFTLEFDKNSKPSNRYTPILKAQEAAYFYSSCEEVLTNIKRREDVH